MQENEYLSTGCEYEVVSGRNVGEREDCFSQAIVVTPMTDIPVAGPAWRLKPKVLERFQAANCCPRNADSDPHCGPS
jgi:hypothetical protein